MNSEKRIKKQREYARKCLRSQLNIILMNDLKPSEITISLPKMDCLNMSNIESMFYGILDYIPEIKSYQEITIDGHQSVVLVTFIPVYTVV